MTGQDTRAGRSVLARGSSGAQAREHTYLYWSHNLPRIIHHIREVPRRLARLGM